MLSLTGRRIAIVSRLYDPEPGAASFRLTALARALREGGAEVVVLTTRPPAGYPVADQPGIEVRRARVLRDRAGYVRGYLQYLSFDVPAFFRLLGLGRLDAVVVEPPPTTGFVMRLAAALRRVPYVYYAADIWSDAVATTSAPRMVARVVLLIERFAMRGAARVLAVSDELSERIAELGMSRRIVSIGNGVDESLFMPDGPRRSLDAPYLLYAGTASEVHGAGIFIEALPLVRESVPNARVVFVGQGAEREQLERRAAELVPGMLHAEPRLPAEEAAAWTRGAVATLASVRPEGYHRAFPTKMYASVACGTRVLYAGIGPGRAFADEPSRGWAVDYDVDAVAHAMIFALLNPATPSQRAELAAWARDHISLRSVAARATDAVADVVRK